MLASSEFDAEIIEHQESLRTVWSLSAASRTLQILLCSVPGVSLRSTPGFMLSAAPRAYCGIVNLASTGGVNRDKKRRSGSFTLIAMGARLARNPGAARLTTSTRQSYEK